MASIDKRPDGKYRARWREFPGGPQRTQQFARKVDADRFLIDVQHKLMTGTYVPPEAGQMTVSAYAKEWLGRRHWRPSTRELVERSLRLHILPALGSRPLASLRRSHIEEWASALPLGAGTVTLMHQTVRSLLASAVEDGRIARNPASGARLPKVESTPFVPLTVDEVKAMVQHAPEHLRAAFVLAAGTGLRQGEAFGLTVDRVDFMRRELRVDRQMLSLAGVAPHLAPPKSANSHRTIALSTLVTEALAAHLAAFGKDGGEFGVVFHTNGRPLGRDNVAHYVRRTVRRAELEGRTWHDLRHHHASVLLSNGVSPALVAERLGHDVKTLMATYAHVIRADDDRVRSIVDASLGGSAEDWLRTRAV